MSNASRACSEIDKKRRQEETDAAAGEPKKPR